MTDQNIQKMCDGLSVCVSCYEKIQKHLMKSRNYLCHVCFTPCHYYDYADLRWIGGEKQVICCGKGSCEEEIRQSDKLVLALENMPK